MKPKKDTSDQLKRDTEIKKEILDEINKRRFESDKQTGGRT